MRVRAALAALLVLLVGLVGCRRRSEAVRPAPTAVSAPVPAPEGLAADVFVRDPAALYASVRKLAGAAGAELPQGFELVLGLVLDLPVGALNGLAPGRPLVAAIVPATSAGPESVLGLAVKSGSELIGALRGVNSSVRVELDSASGITLLHGAAKPALGVLEDWLLVAEEEGALRRVGPYVVRTLSRRAPPPEPLVVEARGTGIAALRGALQAKWAALRGELAASAGATQQALGRPADFGEPAAVLALGDGVVKSFADTLASCESVRSTLTPGDDRLEAAVELVPSAGGLAAQTTAELSVGSLDALLALPDLARLAVLTRVGQSENAQGAVDPAAALRQLLGSRLSPSDSQAVTDALTNFQRGRGTTAVYGLTSNGALLLRQEVRDRAAMAMGLAGLFGLPRLAALREPLARYFGKIVATTSERRLPGLDVPARRVQIALPEGEAHAGLEALFLVRDDHAAVSVGAAPEEALLALEQGPASRSLGANPALQAMAARRTPATFAVYFDAATHPSVAPALFTFGKREATARLELELSAAAVAELVARRNPR